MGSPYTETLRLAVSALAPFVAIWAASNQWRERIAGYTAYLEGQDEEGYPEFYSAVGLHNRSSQSVVVTDVTFAVGLRRKLNLPYTALLYEDPTDLRFPYIIGPGETWNRSIDLDDARRLRAMLGRIERLLCRLTRRGTVAVVCRTSAGSHVTVRIDDILD